MLEVLNAFFISFHTGLILFNLFGWIWKKTRMINLFTLLLTLFSWVVLGIWYGWGYCPCTDWHWKVRRNLGHVDMPSSYIKFLADKLTGGDWNAQTIDMLTLIFFALALATSLWLNIRRAKSKV
jgi:hypothetical protein